MAGPIRAMTGRASALIKWLARQVPLIREKGGERAMTPETETPAEAGPEEPRKEAPVEEPAAEATEEAAAEEAPAEEPAAEATAEAPSGESSEPTD
jgi:hypothetical protein